MYGDGLQCQYIRHKLQTIPASEWLPVGVMPGYYIV